MKRKNAAQATMREIDFMKPVQEEGSPAMNRKEKQEWLEKRLDTLELVVKDLGRSSDDTIDSVIKDLTMVSEKIQIINETKLSKTAFEELPTQQDRHIEIMSVIDPVMKRNVEVLESKVEKTNERIAKIKRELNLDEIKNQLKTVIKRPEMESRFEKIELAN